MKGILWFEEIDKDDIDAVGGKGANLGAMTKRDLPIPPGYAITSKVYFDFIEEAEIKKKIEETLADLDVEETDKLQEASDTIKKLFLEQDISDEFNELFSKPFDKLKNGNNELNVAVRSSATAEDLPEASFAGQQDTYLGVNKENYVQSIKKCWASLFTARAIYYRENNNFNHMDVGISVIVQKLIDADVAGVMFSKHPSTGENQVLIEACIGLGEAVVSGSITPDTYLVDPGDWKILNKEVSTQDFKIIRQGNTTKEIDLSKKEGSQQKLSDDNIIKLAKIGKDIEDFYEGEGQDIEWAYSDKLYILQSRPITTIPEENEEAQSAQSMEAKPILKGLAASPGIGAGTVKIIEDASQLDKITSEDVLVTTMTTPDMVPAMKRAQAIITDEGGMTSHAAIVSRELGIPCTVGTGEATTKLSDNEEVTVNGKKGVVFQGIQESMVEEETTKKSHEKVARSALITGTNLYVNLSSPDAAESVAKRNVDGVGLFRAEFIAAQIGIHPQKAIKEGKSEDWSDKLAEGINKVAEAFDPKPVVYRTLDFKTNEYRELPGGEEAEPKENNPMLGFRGCHRNVKSRRVFELELKAIKKVRDEYDHKNLHVMLPFVRTERILKKAIEIMDQNGLARSKEFKLWIMVEVPSTVFLIDDFLKYVDGVSIGSNDLTQLTLGVDRDNQNLSELFDERDPAILKALEFVIKGCRRNNKTVSICGQAPSVYEEIVEFLVKHGITSISVNPDRIEPTRRLIARVERRFLLNNMREI
jgi:pyruvate,water dikinase